MLKVFPKPKDVAPCWLAIPNPTAAFDLLAEARMASGDCVTSCELVHGIGYESVLKHVPNLQRPIEGSPEWQLLMEWSSTRAPSGNGAGGMAERMEEFLTGAFERGLAVDGTIAQSEAQARNMWAIREGHAEAGRRDPNPSASFDISVAVHEIPGFIDRCNAACVKAVPGVRPRPMGHMGDGHLHSSFGAPLDVTSREAFLPMVKTLDRIVHDMVNEIGGSISAEHGIGSVKLLELEHYRSRSARRHARDQEGAGSQGPDEPGQGDPRRSRRAGRRSLPDALSHHRRRPHPARSERHSQLNIVHNSAAISVDSNCWGGCARGERQWCSSRRWAATCPARRSRTMPWRHISARSISGSAG